MMVAESPVAPARGLVSYIDRFCTAFAPVAKLTDEGVYGYEVGAGTSLEVNRDRAGSIRPGKLERLARLRVNNAVGELDSVDGGRKGSEDDSSVLHFER